MGSPIKTIFSNGVNSPIPFPYINISGQNPTGNFYINAINVSGVGTYTTDFIVEYSGGSFNANTAGNSVVLQVGNFGAVGQYIDFTINGTYSSGTHTINATGHVKRDN